MKLYRPAPKAGTAEAPKPALAHVPNVQSTPITVPGEKGLPLQQVKVDLAGTVGSTIVIAGWSTAAVDLLVQAGEEHLQLTRLKVARPDVAAHLSIADQETGFILTAPYSGGEPVTFGWLCPQRQQKQSFVLETTAGLEQQTGALAAIAPALTVIAQNMLPFSDEWKSMIALIPTRATATDESKAYVEQAIACERTGEGVVVGWLLQKNSDAPVWIETEDGAVLPFTGQYRTYRQDVANAFGYQFGSAESAGLLAHVRGIKPGQRVRMKTLADTGAHTLAEATVGQLPSDPVAAARVLFSLNVVHSEFHNRIGTIDEPIIGKLLQLQRKAQDALPCKERQLGMPPARPLVSVIVPLYGRADFIEHQLMEFCEDEWFMQNAELVYVLDDPALVEHFSSKIEALYRVYRTPMRWVWGHANRGFSGANNLGVAGTKGEYLMFLNSDAFPQQAGWLQALVEVLRANPEIGAVGPRLVTAEGSIQHAGMQFLHRADLGIWVNHHPNMGLDPALDTHTETTVVPAVTGACLAMRRRDFDAINGWDTGYLIGDFEDSDLCLKLRAAGFNIAYCPSVQLTHLERQSFKLLGNDEFRTRVVIYNAVRHQNKWEALLASGNCVSGT
jgi:GT2 family glycosyltransferase